MTQTSSHDAILAATSLPTRRRNHTRFDLFLSLGAVVFACLLMFLAYRKLLTDINSSLADYVLSLSVDQQ